MYVLFLRDRHKMPCIVKWMGLILAQGFEGGLHRRPVGPKQELTDERRSGMG